MVKKNVVQKIMHFQKEIDHITLKNKNKIDIYFMNETKPIEISLIELASLCKFFALEHGIQIWSCIYYAKINDNIKLGIKGGSFEANSEEEAVIQACEWILEYL